VIGRPGKAQIAVYAALGVVLLLLGVKSLGAGGAQIAGSEGGGDGFRVSGAPVGGSGPGAGSGDLVVHVAGAVGEPGVYRFPAGARVADAVERAGGPTGGAMEDGINLAARLADGQQVVVPERAPGGGTVTAAGAAEGPISLGSATAADLETIDGIGPVTAGDIIAFRDENGGVAAIEELDAVPGIGPATIETLAERLQP
jgi:competence protein ComEA